MILKMQADRVARHQSRKLIAVAYFAGFCVLATVFVGTIHLFIKVAFLESKIASYVLLAAKSHASLNFQREDYRLCVPTFQTGNALGQTREPSVKEIPVSSKWDELYIKTYNDTMKSALSKSMTNRVPSSRTRGE